jgi:cell division septum initiation protein DivIVA
MDESMESLDVKSYVQINEKINKFLRENSELKQRVESLENNSIRSLIESSDSKSNGDFSKIIELPI